MSRSVIFDIGAVLIDWNPYYLYRKLLPDDAAIDSFLNEIGFHEWNRALDGGLVWAPAIEAFASQYPHHRKLIEAAHLRWHEMLPGEIEGTVALLERLAEKSVPLYAITNYSSEKWAETYQRFPFFSHFRDIVVSGDEKLLKPEATIYQLCLTRNDLDPARCIFIDDSPANVDGAVALGIDAIQFQSPEQLEKELHLRKILP